MTQELTCCLLPFLEIRVNFITPGSLLAESSLVSSTSAFFLSPTTPAVLLNVKESHMVNAVRLSTLRESDVSESILANSFANSASASSEGPWLSVAANLTGASASGETERSRA